MTPALSDAGIRVAGGRGKTFLVYFDDRHIWTFTGARAAWPHVLLPYLDGTTRVRVTDLDGTVEVDEEHAFGTGAGRIAFVDESGLPYAIDKMGHLTRSFETTPKSTRREILEATRIVLDELRDGCRVEAYLGYGALLGAVREGGMIAHDTDTDLCYVSRHTSPADIVRESLRMERHLRRLGWDVLRMSGADLKVVWDLSDGRKVHVDIFCSFLLGGELYILGEKRGAFDLDDLLPLGTVALDGYEFAAPRDPEAMLVYLYGEGWRVPDPGYVAVADPVTEQRLDGWFRGFRQGMGVWTPLLRGTSGPTSTVPTTGSDFAAWVHGQVAPGERILDLGTGNGRDAVWFAQQGHPMRAGDYSRRAKVEIMALKKRLGDPEISKRLPNPRINQVVLNDTRFVFHLVALLSRQPHHVYARQLVGCLDAAARDNLFRLGAATLRGGQSMWLEFSATRGLTPDPEPSPLVKRLDPGVLTRELEAHGGRVAHLEVAPGVDMFDNPDPAVARMRVVWPQPRRSV
ncbi:MAG: class I SAM-dependent methyltransferase [Nocardioides sp.]|uniref:class I SAM-dependent methyltransferase n=1 Tax=Nocardioides sp. TaxID=35761 RepID=UPI0039E65911